MLVASSAPLDQYIVEHPEYFFERSPEHAYINPDNLEILLNHLKCAAFELPLRDGEKFGPHDVGELCRFLEESGIPAPLGRRLALDVGHLSGRCRQPARRLQRQLRGGRYHGRSTRSSREVSFPTALTTLHEKAIYLHEARQYHVERFDYDERKAYVRAWTATTSPTRSTTRR